MEERDREVLKDKIKDGIEEEVELEMWRGFEKLTEGNVKACIEDAFGHQIEDGIGKEVEKGVVTQGTRKRF